MSLETIIISFGIFAFLIFVGDGIDNYLSKSKELENIIQIETRLNNLEKTKRR